MLYGGFFQNDSSISQGEHQGAIDLLPPVRQWWEWCFVPYLSDSSKVAWKVIRSNSVDNKADNVMYSAIVRADSDDVAFWYFHTAECPFSVGDIVYSGDFFCKIAPNGRYTGPHLHLTVRDKKGKNKPDPYAYLDHYAGGAYNLGVVKGKDNYIGQTPIIDNNILIRQQLDIIDEATQTIEKLLNTKNGKD